MGHGGGRARMTRRQTDLGGVAPGKNLARTWWLGICQEKQGRDERREGGNEKGGREGEGARGLLELHVTGEEAGDADDGVEARQLGADPVVGGRDLAGSRASCRSRRRGGVAWRGAGARSPGRRWRGGEEALGPCSAGSSSLWRCVAARGKEEERSMGIGDRALGAARVRRGFSGLWEWVGLVG